MNDNIKIQLFLRNILLDSLDAVLSSGKWKHYINQDDFVEVPVQFIPENTQGNYNTSGIILEEVYIDTDQLGYTNFTLGKGRYNILCSDDRGTGLRLKKFVQNVLIPSFKFGSYDIDSNTAIDIINCSVDMYTSDKDDDKIHLGLVVEFNKFDNY